MPCCNIPEKIDVPELSETAIHDGPTFALTKTWTGDVLVATAVVSGVVLVDVVVETVVAAIEADLTTGAFLVVCIKD